MTDNEIIKGLLGCINGRCERCFFFDESDKVTSCEEVGMKYALDLINRQKAEIERLEQEKGQFEADVEMFTDIGKMYSELKAEAKKEFAETVEANKNKLFNYIYSSRGFDEQIDNLVKEMAGETNAE